jgi:hypothetical protein
MIKFQLELTGHGWVECRISNDGGSAKARASYMTDAIGNLTSVTRDLLSHAGEATCDFSDEPGCYRWSFLRSGDQLRITLSWNDEQSGEWQPRFQGECSLVAFAQAIDRELDRNFVELGAEGYRQFWGYRFPKDEHEGLKQGLRNATSTGE